MIESWLPEEGRIERKEPKISKMIVVENNLDLSIRIPLRPAVGADQTKKQRNGT
jgi:hypothetical protein